MCRRRNGPLEPTHGGKENEIQGNDAGTQYTVADGDLHLCRDRSASIWLVHRRRRRSITRDHRRKAHQGRSDGIRIHHPRVQRGRSGVRVQIPGGYRFNQYLALEGGYFDLGEFDFRATTTPDGSYRGKLEFDGWNLDLLGMLPVSERGAFFGRVGAHHSKASASFAGTGAVAPRRSGASERATDYKFGLGYQYSLTDALGLRLEAERYRMGDAVGNDGDIDLISAGLIYHFQQPAPVPAPRAQAPVAPLW